MISTKKILDETDKKIIRGVAEGKTAKEVAREVNLSPRTVEQRIAYMRKYHKAKSVTELVVILAKLYG